MTTSDAIKVIAFDPGVDTGWATGYILDGQPVVTGWGYDEWKTLALKYMRTMRSPNSRLDVVVYESWRLRRKDALKLSGSDMPWSQFIGIVKGEAWMVGAQLVTQEPSNKPTIDRMMGGPAAYLPKSGVEHDRDALRHLCYYFVRQGANPKDIGGLL